MKYSCHLTVNVSREKMIALFDDPDNLAKWQDGFVSFTHRDGEPGQPGATSDIVYQMGKRRIDMVETVVVRDVPDRFSATYEAKGIWNLIDNRFTERSDGATDWHVDTEMRCSGFLRVLSWVAPWMFRRQTQKFMQSFKDFAESS